MSKAAKSSFNFIDFKINKVFFDFKKERTEEINIGFNPFGKYYVKTGIFKLFIDVIISNSNEEFIIEINTESSFSLKEIDINKDNYFAINAPAIVFPYIRSFISSLSVQSGYKPMIIPTLNLIGISEELKSNISEIKDEVES